MRSKTYVISACFVLCAAAAFSDEETYTNKKDGYQTVPDAHAEFHDLDGNNAYYPRMAYSVNVRVEKLKDGESLKSLFTSSYYREQLKGKSLASIEIVRLNGLPSIKLCEDHQGSTEEWRGTIYYVVASGRGYSMWIRVPKREVSTYAKEIDAIVNSFKMLKAE